MILPPPQAPPASTGISSSRSTAGRTGPSPLHCAHPNARLGEIINIAKAAGIAAVDGVTGDGTVSLDVRAQGPTKNLSALNFVGAGKIANATLKMPSLTKPLQIKNSDITFGQNSASLQNVAVTLGQTNVGGTLTLKNFDAPQVQFTLNADKVNVGELQQIFAATPAQPAKRAPRSAISGGSSLRPRRSNPRQNPNPA